MAEEEKTTVATMELDIQGEVVTQFGVMIVQYFDEGGATKYGWKLDGESNVGAVLGLLEVVKAHVLLEAGF